jgi:tetratricopeptide (TPR) repeat protein
MLRNYKSRIFILLFTLSLVSSIGVYAQSRNSISVQVFGHNRQPLAEINVELLDEYGGSIRRGRTNGSGLLIFGGLPAQNYKVRVQPFGTDYEEQEQEVSIVNFTQNNPVTGGSTTFGTMNEQRDFYLRVRKGVDPAMVGVVFVQEGIPAAAKKLYESALSDLDNKKQVEAFQKLKDALELFPNYFLALDKLGTEYVKLAQVSVDHHGQTSHYEASAILLAMAVKVNARSFNSWYHLAYSLRVLKRYDEALQAIEKALGTGSASPNAMLLSGALMRQAKRFEEAEKHLLKARELARGELPEVHRELGALYGYDLKRYAEAAKELKAYLKGRPGAKDADAIKSLIAEYEAKSKST